MLLRRVAGKPSHLPVTLCHRRLRENARSRADRRGHRFDADQDMVRAEVYVLGACEPTAQGIAGLLSGAGARAELRPVLRSSLWSSRTPDW